MFLKVLGKIAQVSYKLVPYKKVCITSVKDDEHGILSLRRYTMMTNR